MMCPQSFVSCARHRAGQIQGVGCLGPRCLPTRGAQAGPGLRVRWRARHVPGAFVLPQEPSTGTLIHLFTRHCAPRGACRQDREGGNASRLAADAYDVERAGEALPEAGLLPHLAAAGYARALGRPFRPFRSIDEPFAPRRAAAAAAPDADELRFGEDP